MTECELELPVCSAHEPLAPVGQDCSGILKDNRAARVDACRCIMVKCYLEGHLTSFDL